MSSFRTLPDDTKGMPPGVPYIIGNELAERFSFYGMKAILTVYMTKHLVDAAGEPDFMSDNEAKKYYHLFTAAAYFFPMIGALISDALWGKYRTILILSMGYCLGHACLAMGDTGAGAALLSPRTWLLVGLALIAIGAGGIKPCVSAHVGDQFGAGNQHLISKVFSWFYFSINVGAMASTLLTPVLLERHGPWAAFGLPGILMFLATFVFWLGRHRFVHIQPGGWGFVRETFSPAGRRALLNLAPIFLIFIPLFWSIFDQTGSAWVLQAQAMDRDFLGVTWLESQVQAVNPFLILVLIPLFAYGLYPLVDRVWKLTPLRKIGAGLFVTVLAFGFSGLIETRIQADAPQAVANLVAEHAMWETDHPEEAARLRTTLAERAAKAEAAALAEGEDAEAAAAAGVAAGTTVSAGMELDAALRSINAALAALAESAEAAGIDPKLEEAAYRADVVTPALGHMPNIGWQFLAYLILTAAEVMVSITALEFAYTQAPKRMKSFIMGVYFLGVSLGNLFTSGVNWFIEGEDGASKLAGANYYWFFTGLMLVGACAFVVYARFYRGQTYIQGRDDVERAADHAEARAEGPDAR